MVGKHEPRSFSPSTPILRLSLASCEYVFRDFIAFHGLIEVQHTSHGVLILWSKMPLQVTL